MKKDYSLDFSIERDTDRLAAVEEILDTLEKDPSPSELEQMASYILFGKDENGVNGVQRGEITDSNKRYSSFQRAADKVQSLDEILDNPLGDQLALQSIEERYIYTKPRPSIQYPKYDKRTGEMTDPGDSTIPGMQQLWDDIARLEHIQAVNEGKVTPDENTQLFYDGYRFYQFKHMLIDVRRHQYYLKDAYKPTIHFLNCDVPRPQTVDWDNDSYYWLTKEEWQRKLDSSYRPYDRNIEHYETKEENGTTYVKWMVRRQVFDWENPAHIKALIQNYSRLYMQVWDKLESQGRALILDFDRYYDLCGFSPLREYILTRKIDGARTSEIVAEVQEKFGVVYNDTRITDIVNREIPRRMAEVARRERLIDTTPIEECKQCNKCKCYFPRDNYWFVTNKNRSDNLSSTCKACEKKKRIERGGQSPYDRRNKDTTMSQMQTNETGTRVPTNPM